MRHLPSQNSETSSACEEKQIFIGCCSYWVTTNIQNKCSINKPLFFRKVSKNRVCPPLLYC